MSRVYVGRLPSRCTERDIEKFFKGYGGMRDVVLKNGYGFVEFENSKDADDAVYDLRGREILGERILVEHARLPSGGRGFGRPMHRDNGNGRRFGPPTRTEFRVIVENLSSRVIWQDLKDLMRKVGEVAYADAHKSAKNEGIVEFLSYNDMKAAVDRFDGYVLYERRLKVREDKPRRRSRSDSRGHSRSPSRRGSKKSRSRDSHSRERSHSRSFNRHKERSSLKRSISRERSRSVVSHNSKLSARSRSNSGSRHSSKSLSGRGDRRLDDRSGNTYPPKDFVPREYSHSRSRSKSHSHASSRSRSRSPSNRKHFDDDDTEHNRDGDRKAAEEN